MPEPGARFWFVATPKRVGLLNQSLLEKREMAGLHLLNDLARVERIGAKGFGWSKDTGFDRAELSLGVLFGSVFTPIIHMNQFVLYKCPQDRLGSVVEKAHAKRKEV